MNSAAASPASPGTPPPEFTPPPPRARLPFPYRREHEALAAARARLGTSGDWAPVVARGAPWVQAVRDKPAPFWAMESLLKEYPISSAEGLALMRLAEALLRVPDVETAVALTADQLGRAEFDAADGSGGMLASLSATAISLSKMFLPEAEQEAGLIKRLGARTVVAATVRAIQLLGRQFVLGRTIGEAMGEADSQRREQPNLRFSYDMLGEGARTEHDARRYLAAYANAIDTLARMPRGASAGPEVRDGISIKLSALFSRYEDAQRERVFAELLPRVWSLIERAAPAELNLTIDAEEVDRLELSLDVLEALAERIARVYPRWRGFGLAVQAYQTRALEVVEEVARIARRHGLRFMVRLVKGAYWDGEVKRAQELGLPAYPVFTRKPHTDVSYLACAQALLAHREVIYPQFATHNAGTIAAIVGMARAVGADPGAHYEMQRLHGMGDGVYREVLKDQRMACRVYAPVGEHRDLLAYLVRRLLENGANSSFVHQLADPSVAPAELLASPLAESHPEGAEGLPLPMDLYAENGRVRRLNSTGADITCLAQREPLTAAVAATVVELVPEATRPDIDAAMQRLQQGVAAWSARPVAERAAIVRRAGDLLDARLAAYCGLLVKEAHKTLGDCVAEVREAVDFCRYYADQAEALAAGGPLQGHGVFVCISPWNFPLAIFAGQVVAALVAGNTVAAKPAEQTPAVAARMVALLHEAGVPADALALLHGPGETVGAGLVADARTAGVCFTGSTQVARIIQRALAGRVGANGAPLPLIAETGGLNAMVVDSTALPEQVVDAVVQSAFRSAGQRCSALRLLCVHEGIADGVIEMLQGAMAELHVGDPAELRTDVGPVIDDEAFQGIGAHVQRLKREAKLLGETPVGSGFPRLVAPVAFELPQVGALQHEIFGPVLHVVRWRGEPDQLVREINALGFGLTFGIQTRIDSRAERLAKLAHIGNVYVNRNMIGAVVGVQPFGGEGQSGTGPKAGGPNYLRRFGAEAAPAGLPRAVEAAGESRPGAIDDSARRSLDALHQRREALADTPLDQRLAWLRRAAEALPPAHGDIAQRWRAIADQAAATLPPQALPGPTGESNELRLQGRGLFAVVGGGQPPAFELAGALAAALVTGNTVAWVAEPAALAEAKPWLDPLQAGLPAHTLGLLAGSFDGLGTAVVADGRLAGVCATSAEALPRVARQLAAQAGAIVPLLALAEAASPRNLYRFCAEQTLTINTAAAGGNAALLAAGT
jgi:RHH-type proline utilization regulon transcriptional repressor/proline dehydrogenase/delta 1-pyrroline-5-carboxylate dehydrogenase